MVALVFLIIIGIIYFVLYGWPMIVSAKICKARNRTVSKGVVVTLLFGWWATFFIWLALKHRDLNTKTLY